MLTPQEVKDKRFEKALINGYVMTAVDDFLEALSDDYNDLYKDNAILKSKLKVLVESVNEYRSVDDQMRKALRTAQLEAEKTVKEAQAQAQEILAAAKRGAGERAVEINRECERELARLEAAKRETVGFVTQMRALYNEQLKRLSAIPDMAVPEVSKREELRAVADEIDASVAAQIQEVFDAEKTQAVPQATGREIDVNSGLPSQLFPNYLNEPGEERDPRPRTKFDTNSLEFGPNSTVYSDGKKVKK
ncbi:hypothetical protein FACS189425_08740 [Clostridia bacterium]|nr:hypothetical protein FACS189425_08740 [Clostridia bacterium]